jgi:hypothetical protein
MFTQADAWAIAKKLKANIREGRAHHIVCFYHEGKWIAQYGISRAPREQAHDYIPRQLHMSNQECRLFRRCDLTLEAYIQILQEKHWI